MFSIIGTTIKLTRGDTLRAVLTIEDGEGNPYTPDPDDVIRFAMKKKYTDASTIIQKTIDNDSLTLEIDPADTKDLNFGSYVYDIQMTHANGDVDTFIAKGIFEITEEVE